MGSVVVLAVQPVGRHVTHFLQVVEHVAVEDYPIDKDYIVRADSIFSPHKKAVFCLRDYQIRLIEGRNSKCL